VRKKGPDTPAIDKQPTIQDKKDVEVRRITTVEIVKKLCASLKEKNLQVVTVNALEEINKSDRKP